MTNDELLNRLHRIFASINAAHEFDMAKLPAKQIQTESRVEIFQDFTGTLSEHDIANAAQLIIHNIASLHDHLKKWAKANGRDMQRVDDTFKNSPELKLIKDLWDTEKHGDTRRDGGHSGKTPKLVDVHRSLKLSTRPAAGSFVGMTFGSDGTPIILGDGNACAIITGKVIAKNGDVIGDLFAIEERAVEQWETLLKDFGLAV